MDRYDHLGIELVRSLCDRFQNGRMIDPYTEHETPRNHYAYTYFGLAAARGFVKTGDDVFRTYCAKSFERFLDLSERERGHSEFNLLAASKALQYDDVLPKSLHERLHSFVDKASTTDSKEIPRNWLALRAHFYQKMEDQGLGSYSEKTTILEDWVTWVRSDGLVVDFQSSVADETPLTYHAMHTHYLLNLAETTGNEELKKAGVRCLRRLCDFVLEDGETCYWGRTNNGLFGYINALAALEWGVKTDQVPTSYRDRVFGFLLSLQSNNEFFLTPGTTWSNSAGWDEYMYHTVYNAYTASKLFEISRHQQSDAEVSFDQNQTDTNFIVRKTGYQLVLSPTGQSIHNRRNPRGAGMTPAVMKGKHGIDIVPSLPRRSNPMEADLNQVPLAGFLPVVKINETLQSPFYWEDIEVDSGSMYQYVRGTATFTKLPSVIGQKLYARILDFGNLSNFLQKIGGRKLLNWLNRRNRKTTHSIERHICLYEGSGDRFIIHDIYDSMQEVDQIYPYVLPSFSEKSTHLSGNKWFASRWKAILSEQPTAVHKFTGYDTSKGDADLEMLECAKPNPDSFECSLVIGNEDAEIKLQSDHEKCIISLDDCQLVLNSNGIKI